MSSPFLLPAPAGTTGTVRRITIHVDPGDVTRYDLNRFNDERLE